MIDVYVTDIKWRNSFRENTGIREASFRVEEVYFEDILGQESSDLIDDLLMNRAGNGDCPVSYKMEARAV
jgi:hypothetical protein